MEQFGFKYCETPTSKGKKKTIMVLIDNKVIGEFEAKVFHEWLEGKVREIGEWLKTGKVKKWYKIPLKIDKDKTNYLG